MFIVGCERFTQSVFFQPELVVGMTCTSQYLNVLFNWTLPICLYNTGFE